MPITKEEQAWWAEVHARDDAQRHATRWRRRALVAGAIGLHLAVFWLWVALGRNEVRGTPVPTWIGWLGGLSALAIVVLNLNKPAR